MMSRSPSLGRRGLACLAALVAIAAPAAGSASPLFELVGDAHGRGGLTARISSDGAAATYFTPALLADATPGLDLGVVMLGDEIGITVDGRASSPMCADRRCDVPSVDGTGPSSFQHAGTSTAIEDPT